jgi:hypothetical protein
VIRQAISCDICGTEKRQTNHWFVAYEQAGELRVSGWTSRHRLRADSKHLCGQTCLHKLIDEFVAKSIASRAKPIVDESDAGSPALATDTSLTSAAAYRDTGPAEVESSARLITPPSAPAPRLPRPVSHPEAEVVALPPRPQIENPPPLPLAPAPAEPRYASRSWHAEAWERERARELRANENHPDIAARRR